MKNSLIFLFALASHGLFAGNENYAVGGRQAGLGYCGLTMLDLWSTQHNQANLAHLNQFSFGAYYENRFLLKETGFKNITGVIPMGKAGTFGIVASQFGYNLYNEGKYGLGYGRMLGEKFSAGLQLNYNSVRIGDIYGNKNAFTAEFGIKAQLIEKMQFAAHVYNITRTQLNSFDTEYIPTTIRLGFDYTFSDAVVAMVESESTINQKTNIKVGLEYNLKQKFYIRSGINTQPFLASFGFGYKQKNVALDIAAAYHQVLGFSPAISFHIQFGQKPSTIEPVQ